MNRLYIDPFLGEFGWELFGWQSILRAMSKQHRIHLWCLPGHEHLYQDFATEIIPFDPGPREPNCHKVTGGKQFNQIPIIPWEDGDGRLAVNDVYKNGWKSLFDGSLEHEFVKLGDGVADGGPPMILLHARSTKNLNTGFRNWPVDKWSELAQSFDRPFGSIGSVDGSFCVDGSYDLRGRDLQEICNLISIAPLVIGPTSGPMHLAALCGAPHLVWTGHQRSVERYETLWNPFNTKVKVHHDKFQWDRGEEWQPTVEEIIEGIREFDASLIRS